MKAWDKVLYTSIDIAAFIICYVWLTRNGAPVWAAGGISIIVFSISSLTTQVVDLTNKIKGGHA